MYMASNNSPTDMEATANVSVVTDNTPPETPQPKTEPDAKSAITDKQVNDKPDADISFDDFLAVKDGIEKAQKQPAVATDDKVDDKKTEVSTKPVDDKVAEIKQPEKKEETVKQDEKKPDEKEDKRVYEDIPESGISS